MSRVGVIANADKDKDFRYAKQLLEWLTSQGVSPMALPVVASASGLPVAEVSADEETLFRDSDFVVVLGGDGTLLHAAVRAARYGRPLLGVNMGTLGYLTDAEKNGAIPALTKALAGEYKLEKRMMLETVETAGEGELALNDVCVTRGPITQMTKMVTLELYINDQYIDTLRVDGIIVSTPTGSTAYNLSAGGPILKPDGEMIAITPICPHSLYMRPWVISAEDVVTIRLAGEGSAEAALSLDGRGGGMLTAGKFVQIRRSKYYTQIMKTNDLGFYEILRRKMGGDYENKAPFKNY